MNAQSPSQKRFPKVGTGVIVIKDGKILLGKRGTHGKDTWSVPGGWLEYNESFEECAARECLEETGVRIKNPEFYHATNNIMPQDDLHTITLFVKAEYESGDPMITEPDKFSEVGWYDLNDLPRPLFHPFELLMESNRSLLV